MLFILCLVPCVVVVRSLFVFLGSEGCVVVSFLIALLLVLVAACGPIFGALILGLG